MQDPLGRGAPITDLLLSRSSFLGEKPSMGVDAASRPVSKKTLCDRMLWVLGIKTVGPIDGSMSWSAMKQVSSIGSPASSPGSFVSVWSSPGMASRQTQSAWTSCLRAPGLLMKQLSSHSEAADPWCFGSYRSKTPSMTLRTSDGDAEVSLLLSTSSRASWTGFGPSGILRSHRFWLSKTSAKRSWLFSILPDSTSSLPRLRRSMR
mmetsp:Transcript_111369/g.228072  ORF Transcript_111369/g.228072 Transcript_111369/m.228072 type:complete len:206 (-) Transcript_111369:58-675(-)